MKKQYFVYIMANERPTLYIGVTSNLLQRIYEHRTGRVDGFTKDYALKKLVYFEELTDPEQAILREKRLKKWNREWKLDLVKRHNPELKDIYPGLIDSRSESGMTGGRGRVG